MDAIFFSLDQWFSLATTTASVGWLILILAPRRTRWIMAIPRFFIPFGMSLLYAGLAMAYMFTVEGGGFASLAEVAALFQNKQLLFAGWVHYLAFDLFVGGWIAVQADQIGVSRLAQVPILLATFMLGPLGLALFLTVNVIAKLLNKEMLGAGFGEGVSNR